MFKKGQAAMEFLMTYGWAILVVLAAIGALAYFGVLSPDNLLPERTSFQAPIPNVDTAVITTDSVGNTLTVAIAFTNNVGYGITPAATVTMTGVEIDGTPYTCLAPTGAPLPNTLLNNNDRFTYTWTCPVAAMPANLQNKRVKANLAFDYTNSYTGQSRPASGAINGKVSTST